MEGANTPDKLLRAREYTSAHASLTDDRYRPRFHASVPVGWMNDPNGLSWHNGKLHLFYQYHPYDSVWGPMHWGHFASRDLTRFDNLPVALAPDMPYDENGCFSGTAVSDGKRLLIAYTGVSESGQQQCLAESTDGIEFTKHPCNPVIPVTLLPEDASKVDFRDPKLMKTETGYRIVAASRTDRGQLLSFVSEDLRTWKYEGRYFGMLGTMLECPDVFTLDGRRVIAASVMGFTSETMPHDQSVGWLLAYETNDPLAIRTFDYGLDFYAPETCALPDGRQILIGWAQCWNHTTATHTLGHGWSGTMTVARECTLRGNMLCQMPVRELEARRSNACAIDLTCGAGETDLPELAGKSRDIDITLTFGDAKTATLCLMKDGDEHFDIRLDREKNTITVDRSHCGYPLTKDLSPEELPFATAPLALSGGSIRLRILVDVSVMEIYCGNGETVLTSLVYPKSENYRAAVCADGSLTVRGNAWDIQ